MGIPVGSRANPVPKQPEPATADDIRFMRNLPLNYQFSHADGERLERIVTGFAPEPLDYMTPIRSLVAAFDSHAIDSKHCIDGIRDACSAYLRGRSPGEPSGDGWIACKDRMPALRTEVVCWHEGAYTYGGTPLIVLWLHEDGRWRDDDQTDGGALPSSEYVTHWMLPVRPSPTKGTQHGS